MRIRKKDFDMPESVQNIIYHLTEIGNSTTGGYISHQMSLAIKEIESHYKETNND